MSNGGTLSMRPTSNSTPTGKETTSDVSGTAQKSSAGNASSGNTRPGSTGKSGNLQDVFLNLMRKNRIQATIFLVKGVKLQGVVTWFDNFSVLIRRDGQSQLVYKHAISTIMPDTSMDPEQFGNTGGNAKQRLLQDVFLTKVSEAGVQVTMFLINGVMLQGRIAAFDLFCMLLERDGGVQLAYKHAVSTIQPASHVDLTDHTPIDDTSQGGGDI